MFFFFFFCIIGPLVEQTMDNIKQIFETNTFAILRVCKAVVPMMAKRRSGTIVNIGSIVGEMYAVVFFFGNHLQMDTKPHQLDSMEWLVQRCEGCCQQYQRDFIHGIETIQHICAPCRSRRCEIEHILQCHCSFRARPRFPLLQLPFVHN